MALTAYNKEWTDVFNKAAVAFAKDINGLMKTDRGAGGGFKALMDGAQSPTGFSVALAAMDKIDLAAGNAKDLAAFPGKLKLYKGAFPKLTAEKTKYVKELDQTLNAKVTIKDKNGYNLPTPLKTAFPDSYRNLKILKTEVESIYSRVGNTLAGAENLSKNNKISEAANKAKDKVVGGDQAANDKVAAIQEEAAMKKFLLAFSASFKSAMAKGAAVIQRIKASPTLAVYNKEMNGGGRDISQNLVNIGKLQANPKFAKSSLAKKLPKPGSLATEIVPYANGNLRNLPNNASPEDVQRALAGFTALYKRIAATYADALAGKF